MGASTAPGDTGPLKSIPESSHLPTQPPVLDREALNLLVTVATRVYQTALDAAGSGRLGRARRSVVRRTLSAWSRLHHVTAALIGAALLRRARACRGRGGGMPGFPYSTTRARWVRHVRPVRRRGLGRR